MSQNLPQVTDELLGQLEWCYAEPRVCRVCGASLGVVNTEGRKMACTSDAASPVMVRHQRAGVTNWREAHEHYQASILYNPAHGDLNVIAVIAELRCLKNTISTLIVHTMADHSFMASCAGALAEIVKTPVSQHVHDAFQCPSHVSGCDCPGLEGFTCNPYHVAGHCPDDLDLMPGDERPVQETP